MRRRNDKFCGGWRIVRPSNPARLPRYMSDPCGILGQALARSRSHSTQTWTPAFAPTTARLCLPLFASVYFCPCQHPSVSGVASINESSDPGAPMPLPPVDKSAWLVLYCGANPDVERVGDSHPLTFLVDAWTWSLFDVIVVLLLWKYCYRRPFDVVIAAHRC